MLHYSWICWADSCTCGLFTAIASSNGKPVYVPVDDCDSLERHLALNLWRMSQFAELTEVMRQRGDAKSIDLLNKIRVGNIDEDVQKQIRERFIEESDICMLKIIQLSNTTVKP